ncbi:ATP-dependent helicase [Natrialba aegyptia]|uniref:DNA 3'-5' helicase n=1 Tax=Natrialba aegyptia DSM 13077 TaxID=1227491 RepID=M0BC36_9EURY|nr:ATP-dependent DNA helicase [Natrialba aegyptia]ELZ08002.1 UvrD/REP helicase [Natrialba aegyptia DSM 13077]
MSDDNATDGDATAEPEFGSRSRSAEPNTVEPKGNQSAVIAATGGAHTVEAVAGSGKTTTMVKRLRAEIEDRDVAPNRLLVLTFANEAAHTIQAKLRDELGPQDAFDIDVYTYHSFSSQLLTEYAYHVGVSPEFELVTEADRPQLIESVYDEIDFSFVAPGAPSAGGTNEGTLSELTSFIESMRREAIRPAAIRSYLPDDEALRALLDLVGDLKQMAHDVINVDANDIMWADDELAERCDRLSVVYRAKAREFNGDGPVQTAVGTHLEAMAETATRAADHLRTATELEWQDYRLPEAMFEGETGPLTSIAQTPMGRLDHFVHMLRRVRAFVGAYEAYLDALEERNAFDYDELIHRTVSLLQDETVRGDILAEWDAVYCDEFQDTDESQLELVEELRDGLDIMVVGDSDQAIHEWRGQDPENMSNLPASFEEIGLELNFRSRQPILDLATNLDPEKDAIEAYKEPNPPNVFKVDSEGERTPAQVSTTISHLLTGRFEDVPDRDLSDIAVLVRRNQNARDVAAQLDRDSIPYTLSSDAAGDLGHGVRTVLSYFRILVSPDDDVSWQRVLLHLYRIPEADIDTLLTAGETVPEGYEALTDADTALARPDRVRDALADYDRLRSVSTTHSISELYRHFKRETRIDWFLRESDRDALSNVERLIGAFNDSPVQSGLTPAFVDYLERQAHLLSADDETATSPGSQSDDAVDIMTVHQAKGLDFDTVLLPFLTESEFGHITLENYQRDLYRYDVLVDDIQGELDDPLRADCSDDQIAEEWRVLHVALTRAKERLFLFGNDVEDAGPGADLLDTHLPDETSDTPVHWSAEGPRLPVWDALMDSYDDLADRTPSAVRDSTDAVNRGVDEDPGTITYYQSEVTTERALETVLEFADEVVAGTLANDDPETDAATSRFADAPLGGTVDAELARQHSHTALEAVRNCERKHVLDHVVDAFPDPIAGTATESTRTHTHTHTPADVGSLFHAVAELAYWRDYDDRGDWRTACTRLAQSRDLQPALEPALDCIDRYFETDGSRWPAVGSEVPITATDIPDVAGDVTGYVDTVRRHPDGGLAVLDYKTSRTRNELEESHQLQLYVRACRDRFDDPITHAGYVYVGEAGPATELFAVSELEPLWTDVLDDLQAADESAFENATPGSHCRFCEHRSLGCPQAEFSYEDEFRVDRR